MYINIIYAGFSRFGFPGEKSLCNICIFHCIFFVLIWISVCSRYCTRLEFTLVQEDDSHDEHVIYYLIRSLTTTKTKYLHVEKLALAAIQAVQHFWHYILSRKTTVISNCNPMQQILTHQLLGGKYPKWIMILQEFDLEFERAKSKKSLVFFELIYDFPYSETENVVADSLPDESLFLISSDDLWYENFIIYLQTQTF